MTVSAASENFGLERKYVRVLRPLSWFLPVCVCLFAGITYCHLAQLYDSLDVLVVWAAYLIGPCAVVPVSVLVLRWKHGLLIGYGAATAKDMAVALVVNYVVGYPMVVGYYKILELYGLTTT